MVAGYQTLYTSMNPAINAKFLFTTIRGAGHMVPTDRPEAALAFVHMFQGNCDDLSCGSNASLKDATIHSQAVIDLQEGQSQTLHVQVFGSSSWDENMDFLKSALEFVWYHNGSILSTTYSDEYIIESCRLEDAGIYQVDVYDIGGSHVTSSVEVHVTQNGDSSSSSSSSSDVVAISFGTLLGGFVIGIATTLVVESYFKRTRKTSDVMGRRRGNFVENDYAPPTEEIGMIVVDDDDENSGITL